MTSKRPLSQIYHIGLNRNMRLIGSKLKLLLVGVGQLVLLRPSLTQNIRTLFALGYAIQ